jgi:hypothetical protein
MPAQACRQIDDDLLARSPKVVIKNDLNDTCRRTFRWQAEDPDHGRFIPAFDRKTIERQADALAEIEQMPSCMAVSLKDLSNHSVIDRIYHHCLPGLPFDPIRVKILQDVVIVVPYPKMKAVVSFMPGRRCVSWSVRMGAFFIFKNLSLNDGKQTLQKTIGNHSNIRHGRRHGR